MINPIQAVIWDLDGVILDSADEHRRAWLRLASEEGIPMTDADFWATFGKRNDDIFNTLWGNLTSEQVKILSDRKEMYFRELIRESASPLHGAIDLMRELRNSHFSQALASSTPIENIDLIAGVLGLNQYLSILVSGETVAKGKPAPDIFLKAAAELHMHPTVCLRNRRCCSRRRGSSRSQNALYRSRRQS